MHRFDIRHCFDLVGKVVVVTGGASGLGLAFSTALVDAGVRVVVADLDADTVSVACERLARRGGEVTGTAGDIVLPATAAQIVDTALSRFGRIDGLVNNAGLLASLPLQPWDEISADVWDRCQEVNLKGAFLCAQAAAKAMRSSGGAIVNVSSGRFFEGGTLRLHYTAAKAGVVGLTRGLARELGTHDIRVNCIAPGIVASETLAAVHDESFFQLHGKGRCIGRPMYPADLFGPLTFLLSSASGFMTGQVLSVDGGRNFH